jgi:hypothetical protein
MAGMVGLDEQDPDARRLVEILRSRESRRFLLLTEVKFTAVLLIIMTVSAVIHWKSLHWSWRSSEDLAAIILVGAIGCLLAIFGEHLRWAVRTWVKTSRMTDDLVEAARRFGPKR